MTKTNNVGFIGGIQTPVVSRFEYGYKAGVKEANKMLMLMYNMQEHSQMQQKVNL